MRPVAHAIIVAAGAGSRFGGGTPKQFLRLGDGPVVEWSIRAFRAHPNIREIVLVAPPGGAEDLPSEIRRSVDQVVPGGTTRARSVARGVAAAGESADCLLVHDGVRPFVTASLIDRVLELAGQTPVVPVLPSVDTLKEIGEGDRVLRTLPRDRIGRAQTPQGFPAALLRELHASREPVSETDDAAMCEARGIPVRVVPGDPWNIKITSPEDLEYAEWLVESGRVAARRE